jgi:hypothetical protein
MPGLTPVLFQISNAVNAFVFTAIEPYLGPILKSSTSGLSALGQEVSDDDSDG